MPGIRSPCSEAQYNARAFPAGHCWLLETCKHLAWFLRALGTSASDASALGLRAEGSERSEGFPVCQQLHFAEIAGGRAKERSRANRSPAANPDPARPSFSSPTPGAATGLKRSAPGPGGGRLPRRRLGLGANALESAGGQPSGLGGGTPLASRGARTRPVPKLRPPSPGARLSRLLLHSGPCGAWKGGTERC